ncbi:MFS transporter [Tichowtungia aerotolerans]|uniref:Sodium:melibiose symporter n=1 Tax=Tichowtungia aerotolerans TaxID=2697043 RepID=A0A6P1MFH7_9BACT|nr:MFS transporter [Tichowtungia aerotolerans]QHI69825.1 sodium:melibiose symporter [Tichowtungia aerotolerans]
MKGRKVSLIRMFGYALGEGATSITMNGISNFAMLFYTQVLGLSAAYAGIALSITTLWDAVTDPVMGHITDNTRSRFGRRLPYVFWGGLALATSFFLLWILPGKFTEASAIFWCILLINLVVRTAVTVFVVPYTALGFEMCPDYVDRSRLQGVRFFLNQMVNLVFGAGAWSMFFRDRIAEDGSRIDGTQIQGNYLVMGGVLAVVSFIAIISCVLATRRYAANSRSMSMEGNTLKAFFRDMAGIFTDRLAWYVFGFFGVAQLAMLLVSQIQMFTYVHYMQFADNEKTCVHGTGMVAFALGSICLSRLVARFDKKAAGYIGMIISLSGGLALFAVFSTGLLAPQTLWGDVPIATVLFALFQGMWWGGCGILVPLALSMIADISAINRHRTGAAKDGSYSAVFSFFLKAATSFGLLITGWLVTWAGIVSGAEHQTVEAARNVSVMTFLSGPALVVLSFFILRKYPVDRAYMEKLHSEE